MKSLKKTLVLLVVFSMILSAVMPAFAATDVAGLDCEEEVARLEALGVVTGFEDGTYKPEETITRAQMAVILCKMVGIDTVTVEENKNVPSKFSDVAAGEWYTGHINVAAGKGLLSGFPDGSFRPNEPLTMNQVLTLCVNALGRGEYVAEMGTWPANYIAEATKLGLLDGVKSSVANRGNVAIIAWNTLEAPYVWDVTHTEFEGSINLGNSARSLLGIFFSDFVYTDLEAKVVDVLKEAEELVVEETPTTNKDLDDRQIVLKEMAGEEGWTKFEAAFSTKSKEDTYFKNNRVTATVPESVWANLDELLGKKVTVLFGEDEIVALIVVTNDSVVAGEFVEEFNYDDVEVTVAGEAYEFAEDAKVYVNNVPQAGEAVEAMRTITVDILGEALEKEFKKTVGAELLLNKDNEIENLYLTVSGTFDAFATIEAIVTDVDTEAEEFEYVYLAEADNSKVVAIYDYSDLKKDQKPVVVIDGAEASLEDIKEGNVITISYNPAKDADTFTAKEAIKIVAVTGLVEGEVTRTKMDGNIVYVDGTAYPSSIVTNVAYTEDEIEDIVATGVAGTTVEKGDAVTLYVNAFGEIVMLATDNAGNGSDWEFAYVRSIKEVDENDDEEYYATLRLFLFDGNRSNEYNVVVETKEWTTDNWDGQGTPTNAFAEFKDFAETLPGKVIAFKANSNKEISLEIDETSVLAADILADINEDLIVVIDRASLTLATLTGTDIVNDFDFVKVAKATVTIDDDYEELTNTAVSPNKEYDFKSDSVIVDLKEEEIFSKWKAMIQSNDIVDDAIVICEKGETDIKYIVFEDTTAASTDSVFAILKDYDSDEAFLFNGEDVTLGHDNESLFAAAEAKSFVEYATNSKNEISRVDMLVDLTAFGKLEKNDLVTDEIIKDGNEIALVAKAATQYVAASTTTCSHNTDVDAVACDCTGFVKATFTPATGTADGVAEYYNSEFAKVVPASGTDLSTYYELDDNATHGTVVVPATGLNATNYKVEKVDGYKLTYTKNAGVQFATIKVDLEDAVVYDVRNGKFEVSSYEAASLTGRYVIPFVETSYAGAADATILVIVK